MQSVNLQGGSLKIYHLRAEGLRVIFFEALGLLVYIVHIDRSLNNNIIIIKQL